MEKIIGKLENTDIDIIIDIDNVNIRPMTKFEQKKGYVPDLYIIEWTNGTTAHCRSGEAAWNHLNPQMFAKNLKSFGFELDGKFFVYLHSRRVFILDCVMNKNEMRYRVSYTINDVPGFVERATFAEAKEKADEEYGTVRTLNGKFIYRKKEPSAWDEYWDAL